MSAHQVDPRVARFLAVHSVTQREAVEADVADHRHQTPAERWRVLVKLSETLAWFQCGSPELRAQALEWRDPPHPSYRALVERLRQ